MGVPECRRTIEVLRGVGRESEVGGVGAAAAGRVWADAGLAEICVAWSGVGAEAGRWSRCVCWRSFSLEADAGKGKWIRWRSRSSRIVERNTSLPHSMSRIPLPSHSSPRPHSPAPSAPATPTPMSSNSYGSARPSPSSNRPRPESVYSASNLSATSGGQSLTEGNLAETRKRQSRRDEVSRRRWLRRSG